MKFQNILKDGKVSKGASRQSTPLIVFSLLVTPPYRTPVFVNLLRELPGQVRILTGARSFDQVFTDQSSGIYEIVPFTFFKKFIIFHRSHFSVMINADTLVLDLNPRIISSWLILIYRKIRNRRTVVWGHIKHLRRPGILRPALRILMRRLADGTIAYTKTEGTQALNSLPNQKVYVAPNAILSQNQIRFSTNTLRKNVLYVGRLTYKKNVLKLAQMFMDSKMHLNGVKFVIVGDGEQRREIENFIIRSGSSHFIDLRQPNYKHEDLEKEYAIAFVSLSGDYAGLSITQSLGFGVPILAPYSEFHAPEIELESSGGVIYYHSDSYSDFHQKLSDLFENRVPNLPSGMFLSNYVRTHYSAETMCSGLLDAVFDLNHLTQRSSNNEK
jgi:glycosyltransferase involved in cell wall biosynthesis